MDFWLNTRDLIHATAREYGVEPDDLCVAAAERIAPWAFPFPDDHQPDTVSPAQNAKGRNGLGVGGGGQGAPDRRRLRGLVKTVLDARQGGRNWTLFWAACRAGEMIKDGEIDRDTAVQALRLAALEAGLGESEIGDHRRGTIHSGLRTVGAA